jgi:hypothetical protein
MKYYEVKFTILPYSDDAADIVAALAGEAGFESFDTSAEGLTGYVQQPLFDEPMLRQLLDMCPLADVTVTYTVGEAEDRDWNEAWEQEGFEPIFIEKRDFEVRGTRYEVREYSEGRCEWRAGKPRTSHLAARISKTCRLLHRRLDGEERRQRGGWHVGLGLAGCYSFR